MFLVHNNTYLQNLADRSVVLHVEAYLLNTHINLLQQVQTKFREYETKSLSYYNRST